MTDKGNGKIRLVAGARIVVIPDCQRCRKPWPQCYCGTPHKRPSV